MSFIGSLIKVFVERRASTISLDEIRKGLETSGSEVAGRMASAADTPENRKQAGHMIGIERWGAQRLRSALSPAIPPAMDEYDNYRPSAEIPIDALAGIFNAARTETLALLESLRDMQDCRVPHNDLGLLSVRGWLVYLNQHAGMESKKLKA